jgi:signal transduction histidine kinase
MYPMTAPAVSTVSVGSRQSYLAIIRSFLAAVPEWSTVEEIAAAAAEIIHRELGCSRVAVVQPHPAAGAPSPLAVAGAGILDYSAGSRGEQVTPIRSRGSICGAIHLDTEQSGGLAPEAMEVIEILAAQIGAAMEKVKSSALAKGQAEERERRYREVSTLCSLSEDLANAGDLSRTLQRVADGTAAVMDCEMVIVLLLQPGGQTLEIVAEAGTLHGGLGRVVPVEGSMAGWVTRHARPRSTMSAANEPDSYSPADEDLGIHDALIVPLTTGGETFGALAVVNRAAEGAYTPDEVDLLSRLAGHAAAAIESSRLVERLRRQVAESAALAEVGRAVTSTLALNDVLSLLAREAGALTDAHSTSVVLVTDDPEWMVAGATTGALASDVGKRFSTREGLVGSVIHSGETLVTASASDDPRCQPHSYRHGPTAVVPFKIAGQVRGALLVARAEGAACLLNEDVDALRKLAAYAAVAIENARLHAEAERLLDQARSRVDILSALLETGNRLRLELDLASLLQTICVAIRDSLGWNYVALSLRDYEAGTSRLVAAAGLDPEKTREILSSPPLPISKSVITRDEFRISNSYYVDHISLEKLRTTHRVFDTSAPRDVAEGEWHPHDVLNIPIVLRGKILGFILPDDPQNRRQPTLETVQALELFANQAAIAIDNARLFQAQKETADALRTQAAELERAYAELRASQDQLLISQKMAALGRITAGIAHEINSPLGGILNSLQLARSYTDEYRNSVGDPEVTPQDHFGIAADLDETLNLAEGATRKVAQFVRSIKGQTRGGDTNESRVFDPAEELETTLTLLHHELRNRGITLHKETEPGLRLSGDPSKFSLVVQNLLTNAIDAYEGRRGEVWLRLHARADAVRLQVEDRGCGIPDSIRGRIFDYLFTTKEVGRGTGLGLSIVHSIVSAFGGSIDVQSRIGVGTTLSIDLPVFSASV